MAMMNSSHDANPSGSATLFTEDTHAIDATPAGCTAKTAADDARCLPPPGELLGQQPDNHNRDQVDAQVHKVVQHRMTAKHPLHGLKREEVARPPELLGQDQRRIVRVRAPRDRR